MFRQINDKSRKYYVLVILSLFTTWCKPVVANEPIVNVPLYYSLGGAQAIDLPASSQSHLQLLQKNGNNGLLCGKFEPSLDIQDMITGQLADTLATLNSIPAAVTGALPGYILCRAQPGLCQLLQHYVVRAENMWNLSVQSCEDIMEDITEGGNPFRNLVQVSKMQAWEQQARIGANATEAEREANQADGCVEWIGGKKSGCKGEDPIWLTKDTAKTGWCLVQNLESDCRGSKLQAESTKGSKLAEMWPTPDDAAQWISDVLGDYKIHAGETSSTKAGTGLLPKIEETTQVIQTSLNELVFSTNAPTAEDFDRLSTDRIFLAPSLIDALRDLPDRKFLIRRISNEVALARVVQKALLARRVLLSGMMEPNIQSAGNVSDSIREIVEFLEREIDTVTFELQVSRRLVSQSILDVLNAHKVLTVPSPNVRNTPELLLK